MRQGSQAPQSRALHSLLLLCGLFAQLRPATSAPLDLAAPLASQPPSRPGLLLTPWHPIGLAHERLSAARQELAAAHTRWRTLWLANPQPLANYAQDRGQTLALNLARLSQGFYAGEGQGAAAGVEPLTVVPLICALADSYIFAVHLMARDSRELLAAGHFALPATAWMQAAQQRRLGGLLDTALASAWQRALEAKLQRASRPPSSQQLGLGLSQSVGRQDEGRSLCLNLLVAEKLANAGFHLTSTAAMEELATIHRILPSGGKVSRASRHLTLLWTPEGVGSARPYLLPRSYRLRLRAAESVFATNLPPPAESLWTFALAPDAGIIKFTMAPELLGFLEGEERALLADESPRIVKVYKAWVYLDRGRAWGLQMEDRLEVRGSSGGIKGHVVGFYGHELGLVSPRGFPVHEGAIVYVRKGQREVAVGQEFVFDALEFPTPWPPSP